MSVLTLLASSYLSIKLAELSPEVNFIHIISSSATALFFSLKNFNFEHLQEVLKENHPQTLLDADLSIGDTCSLGLQ